MKLNWNWNSLFLMLVDAIIVNLAAFGSFYFRFEGDVPMEYFLTYYHTAWVETLFGLSGFSLFGFYK